MIFYFIYISRVYRVQVTLKGKENLFQSPGGHTFLIPVDEGFKVSKSFHNIFNKIDRLIFFQSRKSEIFLKFLYHIQIYNFTEMKFESR